MHEDSDRRHTARCAAEANAMAFRDRYQALCAEFGMQISQVHVDMYGIVPLAPDDVPDFCLMLPSDIAVLQDQSDRGDLRSWIVHGLGGRFYRKKLPQRTRDEWLDIIEQALELSSSPRDAWQRIGRDREWLGATYDVECARYDDGVFGPNI